MIPKADMSGWFCEREDEKLWPGASRGGDAGSSRALFFPRRAARSLSAAAVSLRRGRPCLRSHRLRPICPPPFPPPAAGQRMCLKVKEPLHSERSDFQDILVFDSANHGRVLALDGVIQLTEWDEFSYQEMIAHLPLFAHAAPASVLIIGAGDGGVLREVARHRGVRRITMVEIDRRVVEASKTFFARTMATDFDDARLTLRFEDAAAYAAAAEPASYDVVIVDSSDPNDGPANSLFTPAFYGNLARILKPGGIVATQGECQWLNLELIKEVLRKAKDHFPAVDYAYTCTPTYPCGQIGFLLCYKSSDRACLRCCRGRRCDVGGARAQQPPPPPPSLTHSTRSRVRAHGAALRARGHGQEAALLHARHAQGGLPAAALRRGRAGGAAAARPRGAHGLGVRRLRRHPPRRRPRRRRARHLARRKARAAPVGLALAERGNARALMRVTVPERCVMVCL